MILPSRSPKLVDQSLPDFDFASRGNSGGKSDSYPILNILIRSKDIRRQTLKSSRITPNFACFWPLQFFGGKPLKILNFYYKIEHTNTVQNVAAIDRPSSEISRRKKINASKT